MTELEKAARMALEALEDYKRSDDDRLSIAMHTLRQALSQQSAERVEPVAWVDAVMEQAQVFASAWSLVGGRFDFGNGLETAEQEKAALRAMLTRHGIGEKK